MHVLATWQRHRLRWTALAVGLLVLALLIALAVHVYALLQPQRFTDVLERDLAAVGITLDLEAPAEPALFPRPAVRLQGFSLTNPGSDTPFLRASGATIVVPWRALLHGEVAIERVEIDAPRIDLGELKSLLARLPHHQGPPRLPTIATGVHMSDGTITNGGSPLLFEVSLDTGELVPDRQFRMQVSARGASGHQLTASLDTVPSMPHDGAIDFSPVHLDFSKQDGISVQLAGQAHWWGGEALALDLTGTLRHPPLEPRPASTGTQAPGTGTPTGTTLQESGSMVTDHLVLAVHPAHAHTPLTVALKLDGDDAHADFNLQPTEFGAWWHRLLAAAPDHPPGPLPFTGTAKAQSLDLGWLKATGLNIEAGPDLAPAASSGSAAPAASSTR